MIKLLFILFLCIICFSFLKKSENYSNIDDVIVYNPLIKSGPKNREAYIHCLLPIPDESEGQYIGTFQFKKMDDSYSKEYIKKYKTNNLIITYSLESHNWSKTPLENGGIKDHIIIDLNWSRDDTSTGLNSKKLICVAVNNNNKYTIYIKENDSITSKWIKYFTDYLGKEKEPEGNIKCIRFDLSDNNIIGISNTDNQIYKYNEGLNRWIGPINFNKEFKIEKLLFNFDRKMIAITDSGNIIKKKNIDWTTSDWYEGELKENDNDESSSNYNIETRVIDLVHDIDGKLIGTTKNGISKQLYNVFNSGFTDYYNYPIKLNKIKTEHHFISKNDILSYRTGNDSNVYDYLHLDKYNQSLKKIKLIKTLNFYLKLKRKVLETCKVHKSNILNHKSILEEENIKENDYNFDLYTDIQKEIDDLDNNGYNLNM